jgi:hypothetical protein
MERFKTNYSLTTLMRGRYQEGQCFPSSSYVGSPRYMSGKFHDSLYICTRLGCPSLFITFTSNPKWPEIIEAIRDTSPTATSSDRAYIIARVFKLKLDELMHDLIYTQVMGRVVIIHPDYRHNTAEDIDKLVSG